MSRLGCSVNLQHVDLLDQLAGYLREEFRRRDGDLVFDRVLSLRILLSCCFFRDDWWR